ncbi:MAG TPA: EAL domain-containing protein [Pyrinomonadaceae bacterium]|jgi:diguanylate cyclase (GGDEF)-like protein/PAS domain S-box-containing protein|nr:EAL domain-containing protein [Pyrinomonadaceae bacterium]
MEIVEGQRFPQQFVRTLLALGTCAALFALIRLPFAQLSFTVLLLALLSVQVSSRFDRGTPTRDGWHFPIASAFVFLAMLLFDGEVAVLLAALVAACSALAEKKSAEGIAFRSALAATATFVVIWSLRLAFGVITDIPAVSLSRAALSAACVAVLALSFIRAAVTTIGVSYRINQSPWREGARVFFWQLFGNSAAFVAALLTAAGVRFFGANISVAAGASACLLGFVASAWFSSEKPAAPATEAREKANENDRFRSAFDFAAIGMALVSTEGRWLQVNHSLCQILGYTEKELLTTDFLSVTHPDDLPTALSNIGQLLRGRVQVSQMEKRYIHKSGHEVWVHWSVSTVRDQYSTSVHLIFQIQDITDRKLAEEQLHHDAFHDALTGLPNRALFMDHLKLSIARARRNDNQKFAVLYLDLDRFKVINDSLGHTIGDQLLVGIADRLKENLRPGDTVARLGGDEFVILIEDIAEETEAVQVAERIQQQLSVPFTLSGREVFTTVSLGIAPSSTGYERAEDILRDADTAMYRAKSAGKARYEIFDRAMHARAINLLQMETDMRRALERNEFLIHYQPIVSLENFRLRGFEALVRWQHPERGFISPMDFIPIAEETGLIVPLGEVVLREACQQMQRWQRLFPVDPPLYVAVNLSSKQFGQSTLIDKVAMILKETGVNPSSVKLEITESLVMENIDTATDMLRQLRALGIKLAIDDFGTGYSSLSYLHRFPIDTLKIDRSFVTRMSENNENTEIVRTIVVLAQNLGMDVVAEGVETNEQLVLLQKLGCENGQGYFFSKPVGSDGAERIIAETYGALVSPLRRMNPQSNGKRVLVA